VVEEHLNRVLRRADWRFLLPDPSPAKARCYGGRNLRKAVEAVSGRLVDDDHHIEVDLVVLSNPSQAQLRRAHAELRPGGACYAEWLAPGRQPAAIRARLERAGFEDVACYWPWPPPGLAAPQFWLPVDAPAALSFFMGGRPNPGGSLVKAVRRVRGAAWRAAWRLGLLSPLGITARKPGPRVGNELDRLVRTQWLESASRPPPGRLSWVLLTGGPRSTSKVVGLAFANEERRPWIAVKAGRLAQSSAALERESVNLRSVRAAASGLDCSVPRVLFEREFGPVRVLGETALVGVPISGLLTPANYVPIARQATEWIASLAKATRLPCDRARMCEVVEPATIDFRTCFGAVAGEDLIWKCEDALSRLPLLPAVHEQRDFSPWNVHLDRQGNMIVLDWESACPTGLPLLDLVYFLTYLGFFRDGAMRSGSFEASYRRLLNPSTLTGRVFAERIARYAAQLDLPRDAIPILRMFTWLLHTRSDHVRLFGDSGGNPSPDALRKSLFLRLLREEVSSW
jgi:hypothetical protein